MGLSFKFTFESRTNWNQHFAKRRMCQKKVSDIFCTLFVEKDREPKPRQKRPEQNPQMIIFKIKSLVFKIAYSVTYPYLNKLSTWFSSVWPLEKSSFTICNRTRFNMTVTCYRKFGAKRKPNYANGHYVTTKSETT